MGINDQANRNVYQSGGISDYRLFVEKNQKTVNLMLNKFLRFAVLVGPLLMIAIRFGIFHSVTYVTCIFVSALLLLFVCVHYYLIRKDGSTMHAAVIAFIAIDVLLILMNSAHIGIYITWFAVPLISLLYTVPAVMNFWRLRKQRSR